jgi:heme exporter protein D
MMMMMMMMMMMIIIIILISNNGSNWNHFKILQKILEQHNRKARYQGTTENSYTGHSTYTAESANVEAQKSLILKTALYAPLTVSAEELRHCVP